MADTQQQPVKLPRVGLPLKNADKYKGALIDAGASHCFPCALSRLSKSAEESEFGNSQLRRDLDQTRAREVQLQAQVKRMQQEVDGLKTEIRCGQRKGNGWVKEMIGMQASAQLQEWSREGRCKMGMCQGLCTNRRAQGRKSRAQTLCVPLTCACRGYGHFGGHLPAAVANDPALLHCWMTRCNLGTSHSASLDRQHPGVWGPPVDLAGR